MALHGIKVVELAQFIFIPYCCAHLADMGAEVIKIEHPAGGDASRALTSGILPVAPVNYNFELNNRGKKSLALDVGLPEGKEIAYKLISQADIFATNFQVVTLHRLGLDYETLHRLNPRLIFAQGTGWGVKGPDKGRGAFDYGVFAQSGLMASFGEPDTPLVQCQPGLGDHIAAMNMSYGVALALYHREKTGEGQMVNVSLLGSLLDAGSASLQAHLITGQETKRNSRKAVGNPLCNAYVSQDGKWFQVASKQSDRNWPDFCQALGLAHLEKDPRFVTQAIRVQHAAELIAILDEVFASLTLEEIDSRFQGRNVHWAPVHTYSQVAQSPQVWANDYIVNTQHRVLGKTKVFGISVQLSKTPGEVKGGAPELGEHTEEILLEMGYSWEEIGKLKEGKIIL